MGKNKTPKYNDYYLGYNVKPDSGQLPITFPCSFSRSPCHLVRRTKFSNMQHTAQIISKASVENLYIPLQ
jgi:hypothetical protein